MTDKQKEVFLSAANLGFSCGLCNIFEWLDNAIRSLQHYKKFEEIPEAEKEIEESFLAFFKECGEEFKDLTIGGMYEYESSYRKYIEEQYEKKFQDLFDIEFDDKPCEKKV